MQNNDLCIGLDDQYQKLFDRYHDLKLSHNRKKRALVKIQHYVAWVLIKDRTALDGVPKSLVWRLEAINDLCLEALYPDGRVYLKKE